MEASSEESPCPWDFRFRLVGVTLVFLDGVSFLESWSCTLLSNCRAWSCSRVSLWGWYRTSCEVLVFLCPAWASTRDVCGGSVVGDGSADVPQAMLLCNVENRPGVGGSGCFRMFGICSKSRKLRSASHRLRSTSSTPSTCSSLDGALYSCCTASYTSHGC